MVDVLDFKKEDKGCVAKKCEFVFKSGENTVCICNPPTPIPIPQMDQFTGQPMITINSIFPQCMNDTVCGRYLPEYMRTTLE
jgi:hypothetical protein